MLSSRYGFIFLHAPKTGGNSIQSLLEPFSDDRRKAGRFQDGVERFEIVGPHTPHKHATLADYRDSLEDRLDSFKIAISVRHPFERALSFYLSPHRWFTRGSGEEWKLSQPVWREGDFRSVLARLPPQTDFLRLGDHIEKPDHIIRQENIEADFRRFAIALGLPCADAELPRRNRSAAQETEAFRAKAEPFRGEIETKFAEDMQMFGYAPA